MSRRGVIILIVIALLLLFFFKKNLLVAAMVNGQPITSLELNQRLYQTSKDQVLNQMINERIIQQEAAKKGVNVTSQQIQDKMAEVEKTYGGADSFNALLAQQGLTRDQFAQQTKIQLMVEALYKNDITPTDDEINKFMDQNKSLPEATDEAKFKETAVSQITQQKLSTVFNQKFPELRQQSNIQIF